MKKTYRIIAAALCALMLILTVSCSGKTDPVTDQITEPTVTTGEEGPVTAPDTETEPAGSEPEPTEKTPPVTNIQTWTYNDGIRVMMGIFCETEPGALVYVCRRNGEVLIREHALEKNFFGAYHLPDGENGVTVYIYAKEDGKLISDPSDAVRLKYVYDADGNLVCGHSSFIGHDSHVYLNYYDEFYYGRVLVDEEMKANVRRYLEGQLGRIREATGKNTKIIMIVCTNPAVIYHDMQYDESEGGRGDHFEPTSVTQFGEYMKDSEDIYFLDLRDILMEHRDKLLFMQADSHWTQIGAYYGYYRAAQCVHKDFPSVPVYDLEKDFDTEIVQNGGDLLWFMGISDRVSAYTANVTPKDASMYAKDDFPTAYVMGDSYYGAISPFLELLFSEIYLNHPDTNPPLYDYRLDDLETKKPDYLVYIWTERNILGDLGMLLNVRH